MMKVLILANLVFWITRYFLARRREQARQAQVRRAARWDGSGW